MCSFFAAKGAVDGVIELTAAVATFVNATALQLQGVPNTTAWVQFSPSPRAGSVDLVRLPSFALLTLMSTCAYLSWVGLLLLLVLYDQLQDFDVAQIIIHGLAHCLQSSIGFCMYA